MPGTRRRARGLVLSSRLSSISASLLLPVRTAVFVVYESVRSEGLVMLSIPPTELRDCMTLRRLHGMHYRVER